MLWELKNTCWPTVDRSRIGFVNQPEASVRKIVLGGMLAVILFDTVGSFAAKSFGFTYAFLIPGSLVIYGTVAAMVARRRDWVVGLIAATLLAFTDVTLGWAVSWLIGPGKPESGLTPMTVVGAGMTAFVLGGLAGGVGAWIGVRKGRAGEEV